MKKSMTVMFMACVAGSASAQSSVSMFGIIDATVQRGTGSISSKNQLGSGGSAGSRLGLRGVEDLGAGLSASFWLEAGVSVDSGAGNLTNVNNQASGPAGAQGLTFNRRSTVSLAGPGGELRLGRDLTAHYWNFAVFDPYGTNGVGAAQIFTSQVASLYPAGIGSTGPVVRVSNSIGYFTPATLAGFYGQVQYYLGENPTGTATQDDGRGISARVGYSNSTFNIAVAHGRTKYASGDVSTTNIGAMWNFGMAKLTGIYDWDRIDSPTRVSARGYLVGLVVPAGPGEVRASLGGYRRDSAGEPESKKIALGYLYNLSKRTALYVTVARLRNSGGAALALNGSVTAPNASSTGYDLGLRHTF